MFRVFYPLFHHWPTQPLPVLYSQTFPPFDIYYIVLKQYPVGYRDTLSGILR